MIRSLLLADTVVTYQQAAFLNPAYCRLSCRYEIWALEHIHASRLTPSLVQASYSTFMHGLSTQNINLNRKVLSELAINEPLSFKALVDQVKFMRGSQAAQKPMEAAT